MPNIVLGIHFFSYKQDFCSQGTCILVILTPLFQELCKVLAHGICSTKVDQAELISFCSITITENQERGDFCDQRCLPNSPCDQQGITFKVLREKELSN